MADRLDPPESDAVRWTCSYTCVCGASVRSGEAPHVHGAYDSGELAIPTSWSGGAQTFPVGSVNPLVMEDVMTSPGPLIGGQQRRHLRRVQ